ncbi:hypothetical protein PHYBOEH_011503 [Phytophthora boehmeriae]|uniref:Amino acid transporter transmembrane domain-containing protein n=1 Tax=Phytophthora boehmeriae TaxID=109152 RepID=A0A8T1X3D5_9STRA|nr:hypothetical protein PHYBOEH_011503 [Phytophthora boehmeriae]
MFSSRSKSANSSSASVRQTPADVHDIKEEGSDMTREIFSAVLKGSNENLNRNRTKSLPQVSEVLYKDVGKASDLVQPGGFRRDHVISNLPDDGACIPSHAQESFLASIGPNSLLQSAYGNFISDTLHLGEDYDEDEDQIPLLDSPAKAVQPTGGASVLQTTFTIVKSFIGSGILFLPKGFQNGGMLFSIAGLCASAGLSTFCMLRLVECSNVLIRSPNHHSISYGVVGEQAFGSIGRLAVNVSLVLSQLGFCCSYLIFVQQNIGQVLLHVFHVRSSVAAWTLIFLQVPLYTPLVWVRHLEYFALTNLFADVLILFGLLYMLTYTVETLNNAPAGSSTWENFNADNWAMFLGVAIYCFEGIGLVLPTYDAMDDKIKHKFPTILTSTVVCLVAFSSLFGGTVYAAFGQNTQSAVTLNLPNAGESKGTVVVLLTYSLALILTFPLMLYPVINILESNLFPHQRVKGFWRWKKNGFRFALVCLTAVIGYFGKDKLDNVVAIIGGFCSVPLAFIYPCIFHSR